MELMTAMQHVHGQVCVAVSPAATVVSGALVCAAAWLLEKLEADRAARVSVPPSLSVERVEPRAERRGLGQPYRLVGPARHVGEVTQYRLLQHHVRFLAQLECLAQARRGFRHSVGVRKPGPQITQQRGERLLRCESVGGRRRPHLLPQQRPSLPKEHQAALPLAQVVQSEPEAAARLRLQAQRRDVLFVGGGRGLTRTSPLMQGSRLVCVSCSLDWPC
jgi:hypothetical protein